jgi:hypothetical protein
MTQLLGALLHEYSIVMTLACFLGYNFDNSYPKFWNDFSVFFMDDFMVFFLFF